MPTSLIHAGAEAIAEILRARGSAIVPRLFDPSEIAIICARAEQRLLQLDALTDGVYRNNLPVAFCDASNETADVLGRRVDMPVLVAGDKELADREPHRFEHTTIRLVIGSLAAAIARAYFDEPFVIAVGASRFRRQRVEQRLEGLPLHQDAGSADYGSSRGLTIFFPLNGCGGAYPSLEVLPERVSEILTLAPGEWYCDESVVRELSARLHAPSLAPGDAIIFDSLCPHRTHFGPGATRERLSCDVRLFAKSHAPRRLSAMIDVG